MEKTEIPADQILLLLASLLGGGATIVAAYRLGFFSPLEGLGKVPFKLNFTKVLGAFLTFLFLQLAILPTALVIYIVFTTGHLPNSNLSGLSPQVQGVFNIASMVLSFLFVILYYSCQNISIRLLIWNRGNFKTGRAEVKSFLLGVAAWLFCYPIVFFFGQGISLLIQSLFGQHEVEQVAVKALKQMEHYPVVLYSMMTCMILLVPIMEELLFRGFLQTWLMGRLKPAYAIFLTSLIFAFFHFSSTQGISNIEYIIALLLLSCFLGYLYEREKSLWAPIGLHMAFNTVSILLILQS
jgi:uncharacterized protein